MDLGGVGFTAKINDQERRIPANDVAVIDFTGGGTSQADWDRLSSGQFAVLKDGQIVTGQLTDIGGSSPLRLTFRVNGADRDIASNDVARIVLARPSNAPASVPTTGGTAVTQPASGYTVSGQQHWSPTGIELNRGEVFTINATGEVGIGGGDNPKSTPNGSGRMDGANPLPNASTGALIGRIDNGQPFLIGNQTRVTAPAAGQLFLGINDTTVSDNQGAYQVEIQRTARSRR